LFIVLRIILSVGDGFLLIGNGFASKGKHGQRRKGRGEESAKTQKQTSRLRNGGVIES